MIVQLNPKKNIPLKLDNSEDFRDYTVSLPKRGGQLLPLNLTWSNPYVYYEIITKQLNAGNHQFRIDTKNVNGNINDGVVIALNIPSRVLPPRFLKASINGTQMVVTWVHSVDGPPDRYALFGTSDPSLPMDRISEFDGISVDGSQQAMVVNLNTPGNYRFTIDSKIGSQFSNNFITIDVTSPSSAAQPPRVINQIDISHIDIGQLDIFGQNVSIGKLNIQFFWAFGLAASSFNLYHDGGSGTVNLGSPINFTRLNNVVQNFTTPQISFDNQDTEYRFILRAVSPDGVEEDNDFEHTVILNGSVPPDADNVTAAAVLC